MSLPPGTVHARIARLSSRYPPALSHCLRIGVPAGNRIDAQDPQLAFLTAKIQIRGKCLEGLNLASRARHLTAQIYIVYPSPQIDGSYDSSQLLQFAVQCVLAAVAVELLLELCLTFADHSPNRTVRLSRR